MKHLILLCLAILLSFYSFSQSSVFVRDLSIPLYQNGTLMTLPYGGGINDGMFSEIDLNGDGIKDLFVFEKDQAYKKARITTYINNGTPGQVDYTYAPEYISKFPKNLADWAFLTDYNCDGKEDLLTYSSAMIPAPAGITAYKNISTPGNLQFAIDYPLIYAATPSGPINLYVSAVDKPALVDEDGDGDMDAFSISVGGGTVTKYKNLAMENFGRCDTLVFEWQQNCWGNFIITFTNAALIGVACRPATFNNNGNDTIIVDAPANDGASCLLLHDFDGNGTYDYLSGDPSQTNLLMVSNGGTPSAANMTAQDSTFPLYDVPANFYQFLNPSLVDVNNDSLKDLLVSSCASGDVENYHSVWFYQNAGTPTVPVFSFQTDNLFIDHMADLGEGAKVCFYDADADGLTDLLIGNRGYFNGLISGSPTYLSGIAFYKNTGTVTQPQFSLQTTDWMGLDSISIISKHPAFGDLDGDNDADMILGEEGGHLYYFQNSGGAGMPLNFNLPAIPNLQGIDVGKYAAPQLFDVNKDGLLDLIIGNELGRLRYFQNTGTSTNPFFTQIGTDFGNVNVTQGFGITGRAAPFFFRDSLTNTKALVANEHGKLFYYDNIDGNLTGAFTLVDSNYKEISEPIYATVSGSDITGDGLMDLAIGNQAGGFVIYKQVINTGIESISTDALSMSIYPVPASESITVKINNDAAGKNLFLEIYDNTGKKIDSKKMNDYYSIVSAENYPNGIYFCKVTDTINGSFMFNKFIISK